MPHGTSTSSNKIPLSFNGSNGREYVIGSQLGTGSSGTVFTCTDVTDDAVYAVKVVKLNHMRMSMTGEEYEHEKSKLHREVNILRHLSHPNIVKLIDVSESNDSVYVVQELVEGGELFSRITDDPDFRNENVVKFVYCQIADAVLYLHSKSVIHRDIKPENILVQSWSTRPPPGVEAVPNCPVYPVIKVVDFGLSKEISTLSTLAQTWVGTPQYWAPEVIRSRDSGTSYDGRSDVWSIGVLLYVCLLRRYPFTEPKLPGDPSMQDRIVKGVFSFPSAAKISPEARDLINQLIVSDVEKRISLEASFTHPWLAGFPLAKMFADRWPEHSSLSVERNISTIDEEASVLPVLISEPSSSSRAGSPVAEPIREIPGGKDDIVPYLFPSPMETDAPRVELEHHDAAMMDTMTVAIPNGPSSSSGPIIPNIALAQQSAIDQFQLSDLARIQNEILLCFYKIQANFNLHPNAFHLMATLTAKARELQFLSATTVSRFAITAELAEGVIDDSSAFVQAGAIEASLSCVEEIRTSVSEMLQQCRTVQEQYRALLDDVNNLIAGSRIVLNSDPSVRQALEDILRSEASKNVNNTSPTKQSGNAGNIFASSSSNPSSSTSRTSVTPTRTNLNNVVVSAMSVSGIHAGGVSSPSTGRTESAVVDATMIPPNDSAEMLLSSSLRDLRRVDDILGKCRFFWSNVEQCLVRLDHFKTTSFRLLANVHLSQLLRDRYNVRVAEHRAFWSQFRKTCTDYAQVSQVEYQKFLKFES